MRGAGDGCDPFRELVSARLDGEDVAADASALDVHLAGCAGCREFERRITTQHRHLRLRSAERSPDLRERILAAIPHGPAPRSRASIGIGSRALRPRTVAAAAVVLVGVLVGGFFAGGLIGGGGSGSSGGVAVQQVEGSDQSNARYPGATIYPPAATTGKPTITLTDTAGRPYNLAAATRGRVTLVYFGYTNCPDVCPLNMALTAQALRGLSAAQRRLVTVVFVTTDPTRDSDRVIRSWLDRFDVGLPPFVGLRGTLSQIHEAERQVHMFLSYAGPATGAGGSYPVVHAGYTLIYSQNGIANMQVDASETSPEYTTTLEHLITSGYEPA